jgi:lysozyme family protein
MQNITSQSFAASLPFILRWESGFVDDPDDRGGRANKGVTQNVYHAWRADQGLPQQDVQQINDQEVAAIYYQRYWLPPKCDALRRKLDLAAFDTAVNMGPNRAIKVLQQAVGCDADGAFGDKTKAACDSCDLGEAMINYCDIREGIYRTLARRLGQDKFLKGWLNRLNALRRELGLPGFEGTIEPEPDPATPAPNIPDLTPGAPLEVWR